MVTSGEWDLQDTDQRRRTLSLAKRRPLALAAHPAWSHLVRIARELGWPRAFEPDLYIHDATALSRAKHETKFLWSIGETGTQLDWLPYRKATEAIAKEHVAYLEAERPRFYHWDGAHLLTCTRLDAIAVIRGVTFGDLDNY